MERCHDDFLRHSAQRYSGFPCDTVAFNREFFANKVSYFAFGFRKKVIQFELRHQLVALIVKFPIARKTAARF